MDGILKSFGKRIQIVTTFLPFFGKAWEFMGMEGSRSFSNKKAQITFCISDLGLKNWLRGLDLNQRPSGYEPDCAGAMTARVFDLIPGCYAITTPLAIYGRSHFVTTFRFLTCPQAGLRLSIGEPIQSQAGKIASVKGTFAHLRFIPAFYVHGARKPETLAIALKSAVSASVSADGAFGDER